MSSTAADFRSHVRQDSIAQKRNTPTKTRPGKPNLGPGGPGGGLTRGSSSSKAEGELLLLNSVRNDKEC